MTYRERRLAKAERLRGWAEKRQARSDSAFEKARTIADGIPLGQPILVGHHSERRHRRDIDRIDRNMRAGVENERTANNMQSRADNIEAAADNAIYSDDADAIEALRAKLDKLEEERARINVVNKMIRAKGLDACLPDLTDNEKRELLTTARLCPYHKVETRGYPSYCLSNLGGNITRIRKRIAYLSGSAKATPVQTAGAGETATARAGLVVAPGMTTPSRPGKQPRPVWTVTGNLAFWRPLLVRLGGNWYRGAFSFWEDPTAEIESACLECESDAAAKATTE
jgi:hypothetical protein